MKQIKKKRFILFVALVCLVALTFGVYAALSTSGTIKRVVAARTKDSTVGNSLRFSSNYLNPYENDENTFGIYPISVSSDSDVTIAITVCNYPQDDHSLINDKDIAYSITLTVLDNTSNVNNNSNIKISSPTPLKLAGNKGTVQVHKITIPQKELETISSGYIQVVVQPDQNSLDATSKKKLAARLQIVPATARATAWTGVAGDNNVDFDELDAFNYQISGTEQCTLTLSWKNGLIALSEWSIKTLIPTADTAEITGINKACSITFEVGGQEKPTSYMLQFYKVGELSTEVTQFSDLGITLTSTATQN